MNPLKKYYEQKKIAAIKKRFMRTNVSKDDIIAIFEKINLDSDIFLHSSMSSIGRIHASTKSIGELLLKKIDVHKNTLLVTALPFRGRFKEYLENCPVFDVRNAPVEMGAVNKYLSRHPNAERSLHPTHSVIAIGPKSNYYVSEHHLDYTPFGIHSPYYKLIETNAKILMFGAGIKYLTFIHVVEDMLGEYFPINPYFKKSYFIKVIDKTGKIHIVETVCHDRFKAIRQDINNLLPYYKKFGAINTYKIGESEISILEARKVIYANYMALLDGISFYGRFSLKRETREKIIEQMKYIG
jgi:aminoglycoside 3-N-acetyltransferase